MTTFSKKHYEAIALALRDAREIAGMQAVERLGIDAVLTGIDLAERELTATFAGDSASFDRKRFAQASGMERAK